MGNLILLYYNPSSLEDIECHIILDTIFQLLKQKTSQEYYDIIENAFTYCLHTITEAPSESPIYQISLYDIGQFFLCILNDEVSNKLSKINDNVSGNENDKDGSGNDNENENKDNDKDENENDKDENKDNEQENNNNDKDEQVNNNEKNTSIYLTNYHERIAIEICCTILAGPSKSILIILY